MSKLRLAIQKNGRLSEKSIKLLNECGIKLSNGNRKLKASASNFPLEILYLRDDDIPQYVEQGVADIGILGENEVLEKNKAVDVVEKLGFANCRLSLAVPRDEVYVDKFSLRGKKVATSYPNILRAFLNENNIEAQIEEIGGSVEIATGIGLADAVFDIVSTGSTLQLNGLREAETVMRSEAVLIANPQLSADKQQLLDQLLFRMKSVKTAAEHKYILLNTPNEAIPQISQILPGMKSPTILPLNEKGWSSLHSVVREDDFWDVIDQLKALGAQGILVLSVEKMIL